MKSQGSMKACVSPLLFAALAALALMLPGCSSSGGAPGAAMTAAATTAAAAQMTRNETEMEHLAYDVDAGQIASDIITDSGGERSGGGETGSAADQVRKEIKNIRCGLSVKDVRSTYNKVSEITNALGGYEFNKSEMNRENAEYIQLTIKLPPDRIREFESRLRSAAGENALKYYNLYSNDITSEYYDIYSRLTSMRTSLQQYHAMLAKAFTIKDMLEIQREITYLQAEIDRMQGQINIWNALVNYSTIEMTIEREPDPIAQARDEKWTFNTGSEIVNAMGNGFIATGNVVYQIVVNLLIFVVSILPALIPIGLIALIAIYVLRKRKTRKTTYASGGADSATSGAALEPDTTADADSSEQTHSE